MIAKVWGRSSFANTVPFYSLILKERKIGIQRSMKTVGRSPEDLANLTPD